MNTPSVFDSFNAKNLNSAQIAKTFVPPKQFNELIERKSSILVGPRGSGKTTLMRMLEMETLKNWNNEVSRKFKNKIDFIGVFVPTDRIWRDQIEVLEKESSSDEIKKFISNALFSSHILTRLCAAFIDRLRVDNSYNLKNFKSISLPPSSESELVESLALYWAVNPIRPTMKSLYDAVIRRWGESTTLMSRLSSMERGEANDFMTSLGDSWHTNFRVLSENSIRLFSNHCDSSDERWAFLFDELELAPDIIISDLVELARGASGKILYKLSLAPYIPHINIAGNMFSAMPGNDFQPIQLWYERKNTELYEFFNQLVRQMLIENGLDEVDLEKVIDTPENITHNELFSKMWDVDTSLRELLKRKKISKDISRLSEDKRSSVIRKIAPIVKVREAHLKANKDGRLVYKTLNRYPDYYGGVKSLAAILEGNPRWIIGVMSPLIKKYAETGEKIKLNDQVFEINKTCQRYISLLKVIPCRFIPNQEPTGVNKLIDRIGNFFQKSIHMDKIELDNKNCFVIQKNIPEDIQVSLGAALNAGALVYLSGTSSKFALNTLEDRVFRLSYLLAPKYKLPLSIHSSGKLTEVLQGLDKMQGNLLDE